MELNNLSKLIKMAGRSPILAGLVMANILRYPIHPFERHLMSGYSFPPRSISIMITDRCNLRCRMCHYANSESPEYNLNHAGFMSLNLFKHILDTCPGKPVMSLTGGEPLLHQQIFEFIKELKSRGFYCTLTTNGWLLEAKAVQLCKSNLDLLVVSIDGERQTHDRIRSSGSYEKAVNGIQELLKQHDRPVVGISTVINDLNSKALENTYILAQNLGVDILNFNHLWIQTEKMIKAQDEVTDLHETGQVLWDVSTQSIDSDRIFKAIRSMHKKKHNFLLHAYPEMNREETGIYYNQPEELVKFGYSRCAWQVTRIYPDGEVGICREYHAGNVNDQPLREIWNNQKYRNFRKYLARNGTCPICSRCCLFFSRV